MPRCFQVDPLDNVAVLLEDADPGCLDVIGGRQSVLTLSERIGLGHKVATVAIPMGGEIVKFGVTIGIATAGISAGAWVHLHNCRSLLDERSSSLEVSSGAVTDTIYE